MQHNSRHGSSGTEDVRLRPWGVDAHTCGSSDMKKVDRTSLECRWKMLMQQLQTHGRNDAIDWISAGSHVVESHNDLNEDEHVRFVRCISENNI